MNNVILLGRLVRDPEVSVKGDATMARFTLAVNRSYSKNGEQKADFINCTAWRKTAELIGNYFSKGERMLVEGSWRMDSYDGKDGKKRYYQYCLVDRVEFIENHKKDAEKGNAAVPGGFESMGQDVTSQFDEEIPF